MIPEEWEHAAVCAQVGPDVFFPKHGGSTREARRICGQCPVINECLARAMSFPHEIEGVWGGTTRLDRRRIKRGQEAAA